MQRWLPDHVGEVRPVAGDVHEAVVDIAGWAGYPVVGEIVGDYRLAGDIAPPPFPVVRGLGWLVGGEQVVAAEWTAPGLPGEQAQVVVVQRGFDPSSPGAQ